MLSAFAAIMLSSAPAAAMIPATATASLPNPAKMSQAEIRSHNAALAKDSPRFIRCVRSAVIGSLVARSYRCRTNAQWAAAERIANDEARDIGEKIASKSVASGAM